MVWERERGDIFRVVGGGVGKGKRIREIWLVKEEERRGLKMGDLR